MVYVISKTGKPLMPTVRYGRVRRLLKQGLAKVVKREPFTVQLLYHSKLRLIERAKTLLLERRKERIPLHLEEDGVSCARI